MFDQLSAQNESDKPKLLDETRRALRYKCGLGASIVCIGAFDESVARVNDGNDDDHREAVCENECVRSGHSAKPKDWLRDRSIGTQDSKCERAKKQACKCCKHQNGATNSTEDKPDTRDSVAVSLGSKSQYPVWLAMTRWS
jgi:hypothetical protein